MLNKSANYNTILANPSHKAVSKLRIGDTTYTQDNIVALSDSRSLGDYNDIGNFVMGQLNFTLCGVTPSSVPKMSIVEVWTNITDGTNTSNDLPKGVYFTKKPAYDDTIGQMVVTAYDATYLFEQELIPNGTTITGWQDVPLRQVAQMVANATGIALDNASDISNTLTMSAPPFGKTCREIMCDIGTACGGNFTLAYGGSVVGSQTISLRLIKTNVTPTASTTIGKKIVGFEKGDTLSAITKVIINYGYDSNGATLSKIAGSDGGRVLEKTLSCITDGTVIQTIANNLLAQMSGVTKTPFAASGAELDPATELGDGLSVNSIIGTLDKCDTTYNQGMWASIESNGAPEEEDFPYMTTAQKVERNVSTYGSKIEVNADKISLVVTGEGANKQVNTASIVAAVNDSGSSVLINADKVKISGTTTFDSLFTAGTTTIDGGKITANSLTVTNAEITSLNAGKLTVAGQSIGTSTTNKLDNLYATNINATNTSMGNGSGANLDLNSGSSYLNIGHNGTTAYVKLDPTKVTLMNADGTPSSLTKTWNDIITASGGSGTVTSVGAGTGLSISGTATVNPTVNVASGYKLPTTSEWNGKQATLVSGSNIKTINGTSVLGSGNISVVAVFGA